ncbi:MAG: RpoH suppressor [Rhodospirillaceae bacterium]
MTIVKAFPGRVRLGAGIGGAMVLLSWLLGGGWYGAFLGLLLSGVATAALIVCALLREIKDRLPELNFGLCPGTTKGNPDTPGLSNWLATVIEWAAGRISDRKALPPDGPLTFGDLRRGGPTEDDAGPSIDLRMMTTNLSMRRPNALPQLDDRNYLFKQEEFKEVFPAWVVNWMITNGGCTEHPDLKGYYRFPEPDKLPVVVAARMSLSFPFLISAVPLYRRDFPDAGQGEPPLWRLLFSDGGLSSNFPIHFFDSMLPNRPTFGISLDDYNERQPERRVHLPMPANDGRWLDSRDITSIPGFLMALLDAAKDWQDRLQTGLPGYRERVVHVYLKPDEGGLNLNMPPEIISQLSDLGERAGALLAGSGPPKSPDDTHPFDFDDHRWRRFLTTYAAIEQALEIAGKSWGSTEQEGSFANFIKTYMKDPRSYNKTSHEWRTEMFNRVDGLMRLTFSWGVNPLRHEKKAIPKAKARLTIAPES